MVTYSIVFGIGYGIGLGFFFGIVAGSATGITVAIELQRTGHRHDHVPWQWEFAFSTIRAFAFGAGLYKPLGLEYALTFSLLLTLGQVFAYSRGMLPGLDYAVSRRPRLTRRQFGGVVARTIGYIAAALLCSAVVRHVDHPWSFAVRLGVVSGVVTAVGTMVNPYIEYFADNLPERRLGVFGIWLVLCGFLLQSFQYWLTILDVPVT
jgi:hypothetical protein